MKYLMIIMILGISLYADEMSRIEAIVSDIKELRKEYNECKEELQSRAVVKVNSKEESKDYKALLAKERVKNNMLVEKIKKITLEFQKPNKSTEKPLEIKENKEFVLKSKYDNEIKIKENTIKSLKNKINSLESCKEGNTFPKLMMKNESEVVFEASAFRLNKESDIYDSVDGNIVDQWENTTSFTSSVMTQNWVKISGYFVNKEWVKATQELWVKRVNTTKR